MSLLLVPCCRCGAEIEFDPPECPVEIVDRLKKMVTCQECFGRHEPEAPAPRKSKLPKGPPVQARLPYADDPF